VRAFVLAATGPHPNPLPEGEGTTTYVPEGEGTIRPGGYTLVEILIAITLAMILMLAVTKMFSQLGTSINNSRAMLETADRLRWAAAKFQSDINGVTATMLPPRPIQTNEGYFEFIDFSAFMPAAVDTSGPATPPPTDATVGMMGKVLMFTTRNSNQPFSGRYGSGTAQSETAEVCWFVRGHNLHRRVLLVAPGLSMSGYNMSNVYASNDISVRASGSGVVPNTLADLTRRECRFAHPTDAFPYDARRWGQLGLPTLLEQSMGTGVGAPASGYAALRSQQDLWRPLPRGDNYDPLPDWYLITGSTGPYTPPTTARVTDDVILTNVIGFDVKAWDPAAGAYVDLGTGTGTFAAANFAACGTKSAPLIGTGASGYFYDTWPTCYENAPPTSAGTADQWADGFIQGGTAVDTSADQIYAGPFANPATKALPQLRGIQVKIRVFEPESRRIREVTVMGDFLPK
jgi:type II secretory pathway component PulJ